MSYDRSPLARKCTQKYIYIALNLVKIRSKMDLNLLTDIIILKIFTQYSFSLMLSNKINIKSGYSISFVCILAFKNCPSWKFGLFYLLLVRGEPYSNQHIQCLREDTQKQYFLVRSCLLFFLVFHEVLCIFSSNHRKKCFIFFVVHGVYPPPSIKVARPLKTNFLCVASLIGSYFFDFFRNFFLWLISVLFFPSGCCFCCSFFLSFSTTNTHFFVSSLGPFSFYIVISGVIN